MKARIDKKRREGDPQKTNDNKIEMEPIVGMNFSDF